MRLEVEAGEDQAEDSQAQSSPLEKSDAAEPFLELEFVRIDSGVIIHALLLAVGLPYAMGLPDNESLKKFVMWSLNASAGMSLFQTLLDRRKAITCDREGLRLFDGRRITEHLYEEASPWKMKLSDKALRVVACSGDLTPSDLARLPAKDVLLRHRESKGVVTNSPWGTKKASEPVPAGSIAWRRRGDSKWLFALPGFFLLGVALYILREPALEDALAWVMGGIGALWMAGWLASAASRSGAKGVLEFNDQALRVSAKGQVLSEFDFADLKRFEIQTRRGSFGRREKRIVALTHYAREVPLTDWLTRWDQTGDFIIAQALKRGLPLEIAGLEPVEALPDE